MNFEAKLRFALFVKIPSAIWVKIKRTSNWSQIRLELIHIFKKKRKFFLPNSSSPLIASCKCLGVIRLTWRTTVITVLTDCDWPWDLLKRFRRVLILLQWGIRGLRQSRRKRWRRHARGLEPEITVTSESTVVCLLLIWGACGFDQLGTGDRLEQISKSICSFLICLRLFRRHFRPFLFLFLKVVMTHNRIIFQKSQNIWFFSFAFFSCF